MWAPAKINVRMYVHPFSSHLSLSSSSTKLLYIYIYRIFVWMWSTKITIYKMSINVGFLTFFCFLWIERIRDLNTITFNNMRLFLSSILSSLILFTASTKSKLEGSWKPAFEFADGTSSPPSPVTSQKRSHKHHHNSGRGRICSIERFEDCLYASLCDK